MASDLVGLTGHSTLTVGESDLATALGSGDVPVLGTPAVLALCEAATVAAITELLEAGMTSVGSHIDLDHVAPSRLGAEVEAHAEVTEVDRNRVTFRVEAREHDDLIARGTVVRYIVERKNFE